MDLSKVHIVHSPLTETIYVAAGKDKNGSFIAHSKVDRTSEFLHALMEWCGPGFEREIVAPDGKTVVVSMYVKEGDTDVD